MWHYTTELVLQKILVSKIELSPTSYKGQDQFKPSLWFSSNPIFEQTSRKRIGMTEGPTARMMSRRLTMREQHELLGLVRIGAPKDLKLINWFEWYAKVGTTVEFFDSMTLGGLELGANPNEWFASFEPLPLASWASLEIWDGSKWIGKNL